MGFFPIYKKVPRCDRVVLVYINRFARYHANERMGGFGSMEKQSVASLAKVESNRANALKSTGPRTADGKNTARWNALKHGLLSKAVVLRQGEGKEDEEEFKELLLSLHETYGPEGTMEEILVERIAVGYWRLQRAIRFETGMLREDLDCILFDYYNEADCLGNKPKQKKDFEAARKKDRQTIRENKYCIKLLKGGLDLTKVHEDKPISVQTYYQNVINEKYNDAYFEEVDTDEMTLDQMRQFLINYGWTDDKLRNYFIQQDVREIELSKKQIKDLFAQEKAETFKLSRLLYTKAVLKEEDLNRLLRYETAIEKQIYKGLHELMRLQSARREEFFRPR